MATHSRVLACNFPLQGRQGSRGCIPGSPGESGLVSRGSQGRETGLILRCAGKAGNPFQTTQGNRLSCRDQEGQCHTLFFWAPKSLQMVTAAAAKSLQSCPTLCDPMDSSLPGSPVPGILQARTLEWVAIFFPEASQKCHCIPSGRPVHHQGWRCEGHRDRRGQLVPALRTLESQGGKKS